MIAVALLAACGATRSRSGPEQTVHAYGEALARRDADATLALELVTAHRGRDARTQSAAFDSASEELAGLGAALTALDPARVLARARIPLRSGEVALLARAPDGSWRIEGGPALAPALASPEDAIAALRSALMRRDLRAIEEVLAQRTRASWEAEVARVIEETEDPEALRIEIEGDRARVITPDGAIVELAREADEWRVLDVQSAP